MRPEEVARLLTESHTCRLASVGADGPHVNPLWFVWDGQAMWIFSVVKSKRWRNIAANAQVAVLIDHGDRFEDLHGIEIVGTAKYLGGRPLSYAGTHGWLRIQPDRIVSWDRRRQPT